MKATIKIEMDNAAFEDRPATELAEILRELADNIEEGATEKSLHDSNGNIVGSFKVSGR